MIKTLQHETLFGFLNFGHRALFDICDFNNSMNSNKANPLWG